MWVHAETGLSSPIVMAPGSAFEHLDAFVGPRSTHGARSSVCLPCLITK